MTPEDIDNARSVSIVSFLSSLAKVGKQVGKRICYLSPLRCEKTPSFYVNTEKNLWYDFGIGEGGDVIDLVMKLYSISFAEAVRHLNGNDRKFKKIEIKNKGKVIEPYPKSDIHKKLYSAILKTKNDLFIKRYLISKRLKYHSEIGIADYKDTNGQRWIVFPCPNPQDIRGLECRGVNNDATESIKGGKKIRITRGEKYPWILHRGQTFLLTESIIDSLAGEVLFDLKSESLLGLNGVGNVRYLPEIIEKYKPRKFLIALDNDSNHNAGQLAQQRAIELITDEGIEIELITIHKDRGLKDLHQVLMLTK